MIDVKQFREQGFIYDSLENYLDFINFEEFKKIKNVIDSKNILVDSKYDYWYKYKDLAYMEELRYDTFIKNDKDETQALEIYKKAHEYINKRIEECGYYPTWVFGTSFDSDINHVLNETTIKDFQKKFCEKYYSDKVNDKTEYNPHIKLQFYDEGCEIKLHDDGKSENRICVFLYFLNNQWDSENGGELVLYTKENESIKINPVFPNFVVLDSETNLFHEVLKVKKDIKYNIVCFLAYKNGD